jgi:16S rRNA (uracil1498-N3)-methyltransferase
MAERFYLNSSLALGRVVLQGAEAHHLAVVCRIRPGDRVCLFNGDGREYSAEVLTVSKTSVALQIFAAESPERELGFQLQVAAPLPKGDRAQYLLEKLTELGVTVFIPLRTRYTNVYPGQLRRDKLERYVIEASKQCGRNVLMRVEEPADWSELCRRSDLPARRLLAHPGAAPLAVSSRSDARQD